MTGNDVTGSYGDRKWRQDRKWSREHEQSVPTLIFLTIVVVQNVLLRMTDMATGCDVIKRHLTPKRFPWKGGVRACATENCAISTLLWPFHRKWRHQTSRDPEGVPLEGWGAGMLNRKLHNIRPSGAFSPEVTSSNVTWPLRGSLGRVECAHVQREVVQYSP